MSTLQAQGSVPVNVRVTPVQGGALSAAGNFVADGFPLTSNEVVINVASIASGSSITFTATEVDRGDGATAVGSPVSGAAISSAGTQKIALTCAASGCVKVSWTVTGSGASAVYVSVVAGAPSGGGGGGTVTQGTAAALAGAWPVELTDGTNGPAAVKPASTAPAATDPAIVVTTSPNAPAVSTFSSLATVSGVAKASAGNLKSIHAANRSASALYLQVYNVTTTGGITGTPALQFQIPTGSQVLIGSDFFTLAGWAFATGITWGISTTAGSYSAYGTAANVDCQGTYL